MLAGSGAGSGGQAPPTRRGTCPRRPSLAACAPGPLPSPPDWALLYDPAKEKSEVPRQEWERNVAAVQAVNKAGERCVRCGGVGAARGGGTRRAAGGCKLPAGLHTCLQSKPLHSPPCWLVRASLQRTPPLCPPFPPPTPIPAGWTSCCWGIPSPAPWLGSTQTCGRKRLETCKPSGWVCLATRWRSWRGG